MTSVLQIPRSGLFKTRGGSKRNSLTALSIKIKYVDPDSEGVLRTIVRVYYNEVNIFGVEVFARLVYKAVFSLLFFTYTLVQGESETLDDVDEPVFGAWGNGTS